MRCEKSSSGISLNPGFGIRHQPVHKGQISTNLAFLVPCHPGIGAGRGLDHRKSPTGGNAYGRDLARNVKIMITVMMVMHMTLISLLTIDLNAEQERS